MPHLSGLVITIGGAAWIIMYIMDEIIIPRLSHKPRSIK